MYLSTILLPLLAFLQSTTALPTLESRQAIDKTAPRRTGPIVYLLDCELPLEPPPIGQRFVGHSLIASYPNHVDRLKPLAERPEPEHWCRVSIDAWRGWSSAGAVGWDCFNGEGTPKKDFEFTARISQGPVGTYGAWAGGGEVNPGGKGWTCWVDDHRVLFERDGGKTVCYSAYYCYD